MPSTTLAPGFFPAYTGTFSLAEMSAPDAAALLESISFDEACDLIRNLISPAVSDNLIPEAVELLKEICDMVACRNLPDSRLKRCAIAEAIIAAMIEKGDINDALDATADTLSVLSQEPDRKDTAFIRVLASLLYNLAAIYIARKDFKAAGRTLEKDIRLFARLGKVNPGRYAEAHLRAISAAAAVYRSRLRQVNLLAHYQVATEMYLTMLGEGTADITDKLADSLSKEGETLMKLGKYRDATRLLSRSLRYSGKSQKAFTLRRLRTSILLGEAMIHSVTSRRKGIRLLNTLLRKAIEMNAIGEVDAINRMLDERSASRIDFLKTLYKKFSRKS